MSCIILLCNDSLWNKWFRHDWLSQNPVNPSHGDTDPNPARLWSDSLLLPIFPMWYDCQCWYLWVMSGIGYLRGGGRPSPVSPVSPVQRGGPARGPDRIARASVEAGAGPGRSGSLRDCVETRRVNTECGDGEIHLSPLPLTSIKKKQWKDGSVR